MKWVVIGALFIYFIYLHLLYSIHNWKSDSWWTGSERTWLWPKVLFWHLTGGTEENHRNKSGQLVSLPICKPDNSIYNSEAMLMLLACSVGCSISTMIIYQVIYIIQQVKGENKNCSAPMGMTTYKVKEKERACLSHLTAWPQLQ
jgi:hypothetical protein